MKFYNVSWSTVIQWMPQDEPMTTGHCCTFLTEKEARQCEAELRRDGTEDVVFWVS